MSPRSGHQPGALRVALDVTPMLGRRTGIGEFVAGLRTQLDERAEVDVRPFAVTWRGRDRSTQRFPMPARPLREAWQRVDWPPIEYWTGPIDVVHGTNFVVPPSRKATRLVSVHDLTPVRFPEFCTPDTLRYPALIRRAISHGSHVHVDSAFVGQELMEWSGIDADRVHVAHLGIPNQDAVDDSAIERPGFEPHGPEHSGPGSITGGRPYLLSLGTIEPRKNIPSLVRAFAMIAGQFPDLCLVIAGGDGWDGGALSLAIEGVPVKIRERIVRVGYVSTTERSGLLRDAEMFVYPSIYEGFGLPPLEAMQSSVPVVSTTAGSLPEVLGQAAVLVEPRNDEAMSNGILRVLTDSSVRQRCVEAGRANVERFTWAKCAATLTDVYRTLAGVGGPSGTNRTDGLRGRQP
jgi:glycosyltransferase involved in cell wall biosynthesis